MGRGRRGRGRAARQEAKYARKGARGLFKKLHVDARFRPPKKKVEAKPPTPQKAVPPLSGRLSQQQQGHVWGTPQFKLRQRHRKDTSYFFNQRDARRYTEEAWHRGTPTRKNNWKRDYDFGHPVGIGPKGGYQTRVRVHIDANGDIHGHPYGPEIPR